MSVTLETTKKDERIEFAMASTEKAISIFVKAIKESTDEQDQISFKAFTLKTSLAEATSVYDVIMSMVAIQLFQQATELVKKITFFHSIETEEDEHSLFLHCDKTRVPPTKEELTDDSVQAPEAPFSVSLVKDEIILPHASAMPAYQRPGSE